MTLRDLVINGKEVSVTNRGRSSNELPFYFHSFVLIIVMLPRKGWSSREHNICSINYYYYYQGSPSRHRVGSVVSSPAFLLLNPTSDWNFACELAFQSPFLQNKKLNISSCFLFILLWALTQLGKLWKAISANQEKIAILGYNVTKYVDFVLNKTTNYERYFIYLKVCRKCWTLLKYLLLQFCVLLTFGRPCQPRRFVYHQKKGLYPMLSTLTL